MGRQMPGSHRDDRLPPIARPGSWTVDAPRLFVARHDDRLLRRCGQAIMYEDHPAGTQDFERVANVAIGLVVGMQAIDEDDIDSQWQLLCGMTLEKIVAGGREVLRPGALERGFDVRLRCDRIDANLSCHPHD